MYNEKIRSILGDHSRLDVDFGAIDKGADLYDLGLSSLTTVNIMLAIEDEFDIEFPDNRLARQTFSSVESLSDVVEELLAA